MFSSPRVVPLQQKKRFKILQLSPIDLNIPIEIKKTTLKGCLSGFMSCIQPFPTDKHKIQKVGIASFPGKMISTAVLSAFCPPVLQQPIWPSNSRRLLPSVPRPRLCSKRSPPSRPKTTPHQNGTQGWKLQSSVEFKVAKCICEIEKYVLVGGWTTHLKSMLVKLDHFPNFRCENKTYVKPPPKHHMLHIKHLQKFFRSIPFVAMLHLELTFLPHFVKQPTPKTTRRLGTGPKVRQVSKNDTYFDLERLTGYTNKYMIMWYTFTSNCCKNRKKQYHRHSNWQSLKKIFDPPKKMAPPAIFCHGWWPSFASPSHFGILFGSPDTAWKHGCCWNFFCLQHNTPTEHHVHHMLHMENQSSWIFFLHMFANQTNLENFKTSSHNHGSENGCISKIRLLSFWVIFNWTMIMGERLACHLQLLFAIPPRLLPIHQGVRIITGCTDHNPILST